MMVTTYDFRVEEHAISAFVLAERTAWVMADWRAF